MNRNKMDVVHKVIKLRLYKRIFFMKPSLYKRKYRKNIKKINLG